MDLLKRHRLSLSVMEDEVVYAIRKMLEGKTMFNCVYFYFKRKIIHGLLKSVR